MSTRSRRCYFRDAGELSDALVQRAMRALEYLTSPSTRRLLKADIAEVTAAAAQDEEINDGDNEASSTNSNAQAASCPPEFAAASKLLSEFVAVATRYVVSCLARSEDPFDRRLAANLSKPRAPRFDRLSEPYIEAQFLTETISTRLSHRKETVTVAGRRRMLLQIVVRQRYVPAAAVGALIDPLLGGIGAEDFDLSSGRGVRIAKRKRRDESESDAESLNCSSDEDDRNRGVGESQPFAQFRSSKQRRRFRAIPEVLRTLGEDITRCVDEFASNDPQSGSGRLLWGRAQRARTIEADLRAQAENLRTTLVPTSGTEAGVAAVFYLSTDRMLHKAFPITFAGGGAEPRAEQNLQSPNVAVAAVQPTPVFVPNDGFIRVAVDWWKQQHQLPGPGFV